MKKGFVLYFENCEQLRQLPDALYAAVMRATVEYAQRLAEEDGQEEFLARQRGGLPPEAAIALDFMAVAVRRDHESYQETIRRREWHRENRKQEAVTDRGVEEMRKYVQQLSAERQ